MADGLSLERESDNLTLQELLAGITQQNRHPELDTGTPVVREVQD